MNYALATHTYTESHHTVHFSPWSRYCNPLMLCSRRQVSCQRRIRASATSGFPLPLHEVLRLHGAHSITSARHCTSCCLFLYSILIPVLKYSVALDRVPSLVTTWSRYMISFLYTTRIALSGKSKNSSAVSKCFTRPSPFSRAN